MESAEAAYRDTVDTLIGLAAPGCADMVALLDKVPGVYPHTVLESVARLRTRRLVDEDTARRLSSPVRSGREQDQPVRSALPDPHPLDFDWRFTRAAVDEIVDRALELTAPGDTVALLGTPSVAMRVADRPEGRRWVLFERSRGSADAVRTRSEGLVITCDLAADPLPGIEATVAIADPPWYYHPTQVFIWAAASLVTPGGTMLLAQPTFITRPSMLDDRADLLSWAEDCGWRTSRVRPARLAYATPPFEEEALRAAGVDVRLPAWRKGDLLELTRTHRPVPDRPAPEWREGDWEEIVLPPARLRVRRDGAGGAGVLGDPRLVPILDGDVLPTVRLRDPRRAQASVWTGRNRVFGCADTRALALVASAMAADSSAVDRIEGELGRPLSVAEAGIVAETERQLRRVVEQEARTGTAERDSQARAAHR